MSSARSLPSETWDTILRELQPKDRRACLLVSRHVHDVALRLLFHNLYIDLGIWEELRPKDLDADDDDDFGAMRARAALRTNDLLARITHDQSFAQVVRSLNILSYVDQDALDKDLVTKLIAAIRGLPHLRSFRWFGVFPSMPCDVGDALIQTCAHLEELRIPAHHNFPTCQLHEIQSISSLFIVFELGVDGSDGYQPSELDACTDEMVQLIAAKALTLRRLRIFWDLLYRLPPALYAQLTHCDVWGPKRLASLDLLLPAAHALRELALVELTCREIFPFFNMHMHEFPALAHFKLMSLDTGHGADELGPLARFIRTKPHLRRLDLDLPGSARAGVMELLRAISELRELEALGIDLRTLNSEDDLQVVAKHIPGTLCAIHMQTCWENMPLNTPEVAELLDRLADILSLEFMHLDLVASESDTAEEIAFAIPQLRTVALGTQFWSVDRASPGTTFRAWSKKQVAFRSEDTVGPMGEWLLRYHAL